MSRPLSKQLHTAVWLLAMFRQQLAENKATGAHEDRIDALREGEATWAARVAELEALLAPDAESGE